MNRGYSAGGDKLADAGRKRLPPALRSAPRPSERLADQLAFGMSQQDYR